MNMPQNPNFDIRNPRQYPTYDNGPISVGKLLTGQRIVKSVNAKVLFWAFVAIFATLALFENHLLASPGSNIAGNRLLFVAGLVLGLWEGVLMQKRRSTNSTPFWIRIALVIAILAASYIIANFLGNNSFFLSLCEGIVAGSGACYAIAVYRSNWASYS